MNIYISRVDFEVPDLRVLRTCNSRSRCRHTSFPMGAEKRTHWNNHGRARAVGRDFRRGSSGRGPALRRLGTCRAHYFVGTALPPPVMDESDHFVSVVLGAFNVLPLSRSVHWVHFWPRAWTCECFIQKGIVRGDVPWLGHRHSDIVDNPDRAAPAASFVKSMCFHKSAHPFVVPVGTVRGPFNSDATSFPENVVSNHFERGP